jgi:uncharacterized damage-inducible protein DinB
MDTPEKLAGRLQAEAAKTIAFFSKLSDEEWHIEVYTENTIWSIRNVLTHFVTAERGFLRLFESIRSGGTGVPEDFSIDRFNAEQQERVKDLSPHVLMDDFRKVRSEMCAWVASLSGSDLEKQGRHPFLSQASLKEMIKMVYLHNQIHLRDIRKNDKR